MRVDASQSAHIDSTHVATRLLKDTRHKVLHTPTQLNGEMWWAESNQTLNATLHNFALLRLVHMRSLIGEKRGPFWLLYRPFFGSIGPLRSQVLDRQAKNHPES